MQIVHTNRRRALVGGVKGQAEYIVAGSFTWVCPVGVTEVCVVAIGGGGGGIHYNAGTYTMSGGGGAALGWKNNIPVVEGVSYSVVVGAGGIGGAYSTGSQSGTASSFEADVIAPGGNPGRYNTIIAPSAAFTGDGGGLGGGVKENSNTNFGPQGGGGAGGYTGNGGDGGNTQVGYGPTSGAGGGGAGGGNNGSNRGYGGGGSSIYGEGSSGVANVATGGQGGSGGADGDTSGFAGDYGAGGGGSTANAGRKGSDGAVRIIWGEGRAFPSTQTQDL